jgi:tripartite-type tricarboxylate transporter receptor subunit TctC
LNFAAAASSNGVEMARPKELRCLPSFLPTNPLGETPQPIIAVLSSILRNVVGSPKLEGTMKIPRRPFVLGTVTAAAAILLALFSQDAQPQAASTIKIIVPLAPGGGADILTRLLADVIRRTQGMGVIVENRAGAGSVIGTEAVSRAAPDGKTLLINTPNLIIAAHLRKLNYDPITSFEPICKLVNSPTVIAVNVASPYRSLADLVNAARTHPGELTLASVGPATTLNVGVEKLKRATRVDFTYVPFSGTSAAVNALLGQHVTSILAEYPAVAEQLKAGKLRALATGSAMRFDPLLDVPTVAQSGYPGFGVEVWWGAFAPARTPKATVSALADVFSRALRAPEIQEKLVALGYYPASLCGADFVSFMHEQNEEYGQIIDEANIRAE